MNQPFFLNHIRRLLFSQRAVQSSDAELLDRFCRHHDEEAFASLVQRHGPAVWRVCRRMLRDEHLAEDVFQATILVLARRAATIRRQDAVGGWLHGVATRLSLKARLAESKRPLGPLTEDPPAPDDPEQMTVRELRAVLDEELLQLPDKLRYPLILCYLEGKTRDEAAQQLNCPLETLKSRLERGREVLQARLEKRHLALSTAFLSLLVAEGTGRAAPPAALLHETATAAARFDPASAGALSPRAVGLAQETLAGMRLAKLKAIAGVALLLGALAMTALLIGPALGGKSSRQAGFRPDVFEGPPAPLVPRLRADLPALGGPLRRLVVEERVGVARRRELVRVPLFFHDGECLDPHGLQVFAHDDLDRKSPLPYQPDDIRRDPDGSISRMHLYFAVDLRPWERQQFVILAGDNPSKQSPVMSLKEEKGQVTLAGDDLQLSFWTEGSNTGGIARIQTSLGKIDLPDGLLAPRLTLQRQTGDLTMSRTSQVSYQKPEEIEVRDLRFGAGPLFAKLIVRVGPKGKPDSAEFTYLVPRHGHHFVQTERLFPEDSATTDVVGASTNTLLAGRLVLGTEAADQRVVSVPAGLRRLTRSTQGFANAALVNDQAGLSLLPVPYVQTGVQGIESLPNGELRFAGPGFQRTGAGSKDLRAFWGQVRFVFSRAVTEEDLWETGRAHSQPLTAVVDEPGLVVAELHGQLRDLMKQFPPVHSRSWMQEIGRLYTLEDAAALNKVLASGPKPEESLAYWRDGAVKARDALSQGGLIPIRENDKGKASGPLDPWSLTYYGGPLFGLASLGELGELSDRLDRICLAIGRAQRDFNGRVDDRGFPYIDCYRTAFNMQTGSIQAGIHGARKAGDLDLLQFYRDCGRSGGVLDIYGHGQRTYTSLPRDLADLLFENNCDFYLRAAELAGDEDFWLHPAVFGRYFDRIDVTADLNHRTLAESDRPPSWYRANWFRGPNHDHQYWEDWAAGPFLGLVARAEDQGRVGLTEASYFARHLTGRLINGGGPEITTFFHADIALREGLKRYRPQPAPALPGDIQVQQQAGQAIVRWKPLAGDLLGYRVYRADRMGGPWTLVNSPYTQVPAPLVQGSQFTDPSGKPGQVYFITAVDSKRRESRWFADEPSPRPNR